MSAEKCKGCGYSIITETWIYVCGCGMETCPDCEDLCGCKSSWLDAKLPFIDGLLMDISDDMPDGAWYQSRLDTIEWAMTSDDCSEVFEDKPDGVDEYDVMNWWIANRDGE